MNPSKYIKKVSLICMFVLTLAVVGYGTYVYADKYDWYAGGGGPSNQDWQVVAQDSNYFYAADHRTIYRSSNGISWDTVFYFEPGVYQNYSIKSMSVSKNATTMLVILKSNGALDDYPLISNDSGTTFVPLSNYGYSFNSPNLSDTAISDDGSKVFIVDSNNGAVYSSLYGGFDNTWSSVSMSAYGTPESITISNDGGRVYVTIPNNSPPFIIRSTNAGVDFSNDTVTGEIFGYVDIGTSRDGLDVYGIDNSGNVSRSSDFGLNFYNSYVSTGVGAFKSISVSDDGSKIVAVANNGALFVSTDYGVNFEQETGNIPNTSLWNDVLISADGSQILAVSSNAYLQVGNLDTQGPNIANIQSQTANGVYKTGGISFQIDFDDIISASQLSTLSIEFETGPGVDKTCDVSTVSGSRVTYCSFSIEQGDDTLGSSLTIKSITGNLIDDAGNSNSSPSLPSTYTLQEQNIIIDARAPTTSLTTPTNLSVASSTIALAASASDAGSGVVGVQFKVGTTNIGSEDTTSPYGTSLDTTTLSDGAYTLNAVARDVAGNFATSSVSITVDNTAPVAPGTPDLTVGTDTGDSSADNSTSIATPQFTVSCVNGSTVRIFRAGSTLLGSGACSSGTVTITSSTLAEGSHAITARQLDAVGNTSSASAGLNITIDTTAPTISSVSSDKTNGSYTVGEVIDIDVTFSEVVQSAGNITVTLETGTTDRTCAFSVSNSATGTCNYTVQAGDITSDLTVSSISGTIRDVAGNSLTNFVPATNLAANKALVIDTTAPVAPAPPSSESQPSQSSGSVQSSGPTAYSSAPSSPIPGIYNPAGTSVNNENTSATKVSASTIVQSAGISPNFNFTQNATVRSINNEVINIQRMLNIMGYTVATNGVGSKGNESQFFGPKTRLALIRFQRAFAIPATGFFGPLSRAAMNRILNSIR